MNEEGLILKCSSSVHRSLFSLHLSNVPAAEFSMDANERMCYSSQVSLCFHDDCGFGREIGTNAEEPRYLGQVEKLVCNCLGQREPLQIQCRRLTWDPL